MTITYNTERILAEISSTGTSAKRLTLTSWNGRESKLDLRVWRTDEEPAKPGKGITLAPDEAEALYNALREYLKKP
jgi:hypothetical protein